MYVQNKSGRIVDVNERLEESMVRRQDLKILSVSSNFWRMYPDYIECLKQRNPELITDEEFLARPKPEEVHFVNPSDIVDYELNIPFNKKHIIIYTKYLPKLGGIETAIYQLAKALQNKYFVTIAYGGCDSDQTVEKYAKVAHMFEINNRAIQCDVCLLASNYLKPQLITAKAWIQWIHTDYKKDNNLQLVGNKDIDAYVAVSQHVARVSKEMFDIDCEVIYNLLDPTFGKNTKVLRLVTNSRIAPEKGFYRPGEISKVARFAKLLKQANINFSWVICGDNVHMQGIEESSKEELSDIENVSFVGYKQDILANLMSADYLVQLSDWEGCPYAVLEALQCGVPCIVTNWGGVEELIQDGYNGYVLDQDIKNVDINKIVNQIPKDFDTSPKSTTKNWDKLFKKVLRAKTSKRSRAKV